MNRFIEFFVNDNLTGMSMSRLLMFGCFVVTSAVMFYLARSGGMNEGYFAMYIGAWSGTYMVGKGIDMRAGK
jgi:hypothetical protein